MKAVNCLLDYESLAFEGHGVVLLTHQIQGVDFAGSGWFVAMLPTKFETSATLSDMECSQCTRFPRVQRGPAKFSSTNQVLV